MQGKPHCPQLLRDKLFPLVSSLTGSRDTMDIVAVWHSKDWSLVKRRSRVTILDEVLWINLQCSNAGLLMKLLNDVKGPRETHRQNCDTRNETFEVRVSTKIIPKNLHSFLQWYILMQTETFFHPWRQPCSIKTILNIWPRNKEPLIRRKLQLCQRGQRPQSGMRRLLEHIIHSSTVKDKTLSLHNISIHHFRLFCNCKSTNPTTAIWNKPQNTTFFEVTKKTNVILFMVKRRIIVSTYTHGFISHGGPGITIYQHPFFKITNYAFQGLFQNRFEIHSCHCSGRKRKLIKCHTAHSPHANLRFTVTIADCSERLKGSRTACTGRWGSKSPDTLYNRSQRITLAYWQVGQITSAPVFETLATSEKKGIQTCYGHVDTLHVIVVFVNSSSNSTTHVALHKSRLFQSRQRKEVPSSWITWAGFMKNLAAEMTWHAGLRNESRPLQSTKGQQNNPMCHLPPLPASQAWGGVFLSCPFHLSSPVVFSSLSKSETPDAFDQQHVE